MAKSKNPLFSLNAIGALGKHLVFRKRGKGIVAQQTARPVDRRSFAQLQWRTMYQKAVALWHLLSPAEKAAWEAQATPLHMIGFAYFISQALKPNPGIYLPLAGGTMQGDVDFDGHKILNLPAPTADEEPFRKGDTVDYLMAEKFFLPYILYRNLDRFMHIQFDSYDMISQHTSGTGSVLKLFFNPIVNAGATSGGIAILYQNSTWLYVHYAGYYMLFIQAGYLKADTVDSTGFLGYALSDNHHIVVDDITKHCGFVFYVSGATKTVYAQNANGSTCTKTDLSLDPTSYRTYAIITEPDGTIKFYADWSLVATHTTNVPAGNVCWKESIVNAENSNNFISARNFTYSHYPQ